MRSDFPGLFAATLTCFVLAVSTNSFAQVSRTTRRVDPNSQSQRDMQAREWALTHIPEEVNKHFKKNTLSLFAQIREDFTRIQVIDNEMMQTVFVKKVFNIDSIDAATSEINKRALRLREYLVLPRPANETNDGKQEPPNDEKEVRGRLVALDRAIIAFVNNPVFKQPQVFDTPSASQAGQDLAEIIQLSKELKRRRIAKAK